MMHPYSVINLMLLVVSSLNMITAKKVRKESDTNHPSSTLSSIDMNLSPLKVARIEAEDFKPTRKTLADRLALPNTYNDIPEYVCIHVILAFVDLNE